MSRIATFVLLSLVLTASAIGQPAGQPPLADKLPADCLLYLGWGGAGPNNEALKQTGIGRVINDPEVRPHVDKMWAQLEAFVKKQAEGELPPGLYDALRSLVLDVVVDRPWALSLIDVKLPGPANPEPDVQVVLLVDLGDKAEAAMKNIDAVIKALLPAEMQAEVEEVQVAGAKLRQMMIDPNTPPLLWGEVNKHLLVALGAATAEKVVPLVVGVENEKLPRLTMNKQFAKVSGKIGGGLLCLYVDTGRIRGELLPMILALAVQDEEKIAEINKVVEALGLDAVDALGLSARPDGKDFLLQSYVLAPRGKPGLLALVDQKPVDESLLATVPADVTFAIALNLDRVKLLDELEKQLAKFPEAKSKFIEFRMKLLQAGVNLRTDLAEPFGDGIAIYNSPAAGGFLITGLTVVAEVKDAAKARASMLKAEEAIIKLVAERLNRPDMMLMQAVGISGEGVQFRSATFGKQEYRYVTTRGMPMPFAPAWCVTDKYFVIAPFPQMLKAALNKIDAGKDGSLLENKWFAGQLRQAKGAAAVSYVNDRQLVRILYPALLPIWQVVCSMAAGEGVELDVNALPQQDVLLAHLGDSFSANVPDGEGIYSVSRSSTAGVGGLLFTVPLWFFAHQSSRADSSLEFRAVPIPPGEELHEVPVPAEPELPVRERTDAPFPGDDAGRLLQHPGRLAG